MSTILLNFAHPITDAQRADIERLLEQPIARIIDVRSQMDHGSPAIEQVRQLVDDLPLTGVEWQTLPLLLNVPALSLFAVVLIAEVHGSAGYFPPVVRIRPVETVPVRYEVAEIVDLQSIRDIARNAR